MNKVILAFTILIFACVPKSNYEKLKSENESLKKEIEDLKSKDNSIDDTSLNIDSIQTQIDLLFKEFERPSKEVALEKIKDYYDFYNANYVFRNAKIRRVDDNKFVISLEECLKKNSYDEFFWTHRVAHLRINIDGSYIVNYE